MKKQNALKSALCLLLSCCMLWIQCCTIGGCLIGGSIRTKKGVVQTNFRDIQIGTIVEIQLLDGDTIKGEYRGFGVTPQEEYKKKYKKCKEQRLVNPILPEPGDSITIHLTSGEEIPCELDGFGLIGIKEEFGYSVIVRKTNAMKKSNYDMKTISGISTVRGEFIANTQLQVSIDCYDIPIKSCINFKNKDGIQYIAFNEVAQINKTIRERTLKGAIIGLLVGFAIDVLLFVVIIGLEAAEPITINSK